MASATSSAPGTGPDAGAGREAAKSGRPGERHALLLRLDPALAAALQRWAADELRSTNAQIELLLRRALAEAGRAPKTLSEPRKRGRPKTQ